MTAATSTRSWSVLYKAHSRARQDVWAVIEGVPADRDREDVEAVLQAWKHWPSWEGRASLGSTITVTSTTRRHLVDERVTRISWGDELLPDVRRIQIHASGEMYAAVRAAARGEGISMAAWVTRTLSDALGVSAEGVPA